MPSGWRLLCFIVRWTRCGPFCGFVSVSKVYVLTLWSWWVHVCVRCSGDRGSAITLIEALARWGLKGVYWKCWHICFYAHNASVLMWGAVWVGWISRAIAWFPRANTQQCKSDVIISTLCWVCFCQVNQRKKHMFQLFFNSFSILFHVLFEYFI